MSQRSPGHWVSHRFRRRRRGDGGRSRVQQEPTNNTPDQQRLTVEQERTVSRTINRCLRREKRAERKVFQFFLVGPAGSGINTFQNTLLSIGEFHQYHENPQKRRINRPRAHTMDTRSALRHNSSDIFRQAIVSATLLLLRALSSERQSAPLFRLSTEATLSQTDFQHDPSLLSFTVSRLLTHDKRFVEFVEWHLTHTNRQYRAAAQILDEIKNAPDTINQPPTDHMLSLIETLNDEPTRTVHLAPDHNVHLMATRMDGLFDQPSRFARFVEPSAKEMAHRPGKNCVAFFLDISRFDDDPYLSECLSRFQQICMELGETEQGQDIWVSVFLTKTDIATRRLQCGAVPNLAGGVFTDYRARIDCCFEIGDHVASFVDDCALEFGLRPVTVHHIVATDTESVTQCWKECSASRASLSLSNLL